MIIFKFFLSSREAFVGDVDEKGTLPAGRKVASDPDRQKSNNAFL
jgi:hypothetical protein